MRCLLAALCILLGPTMASAKAPFNAEAATSALDAIMHRLVAGTEDGGAGLSNPVFEVRIPARQFEYRFAHGSFRADSEVAMTPDHGFHTASTGKLFTAALILILASDGALGPAGLDSTLEDIGLFEDAVLDRLLLIDGKAYGRGITPRHLLLHSGGLKDQFMDDADGTWRDHGGLAPGGLMVAFQQSLPEHIACVENPDCDGSGLLTRKRWSHWDPSKPDEAYAGMLNYYLNRVGPVGLCRPGTCYHYSDVGYVILGLIAEYVGERQPASPVARSNLRSTGYGQRAT